MSSVVVGHNLGLDSCTTHIGRGIHMADKADGGHILATLACLDGTHHIAVGIHSHVGHTQLNHLVAQCSQQDQLLVGRREGDTVLIALSIKPYIFQKSLFQFHSLFLSTVDRQPSTVNFEF